MPGSVLKVLNSYHPLSHSSPWVSLQRELHAAWRARGQEGLSPVQHSQKQRTKVPHHTGHIFHLNPLGWWRDCPSPDPREEKPVMLISQAALREPGQREAQHKHQEGHTTVQSHRDHNQPSQDSQSLGQGPPELRRQATHTFRRAC